MNNSTARLTVAGTNNQQKAPNNQLGPSGSGRNSQLGPSGSGRNSQLGPSRNSQLGPSRNSQLGPSRNSQLGPSGSGRNSQLAALIIGLIVVALLWVLGNYIYNYYSTNKQSKVIKSVVLGSPQNGQTEFDIGSSELAKSNYSNEYSLSFWVYVDDYSYRQGLPKFIMRRGNIKTGVNPEIYLDPSVNMLKVNVSMMGNSQIGQMAGPEAKTTTTSGATTTTEPFTNVPRMDGETQTNNSNEFNSDSAAAPGLIANPHKLLDKMNDNSAHIPDIYDNSYFELVSGNEVGSINQSGVDLKHNPELNFVLEQFGPTESTQPCECPDDKESAAASAAERAEFEAKAGRCMVQAFPLQKWVHVVVSQYNQVLDIYIDGKLSSSCVLPGFPDVVQDDLVIAPEDGFSGKITKVVYLNSAVSADEAYSLYADGPDYYETIISRVPNWAWGFLILVILAVIIYSFV